MVTIRRGRKSDLRGVVKVIRHGFDRFILPRDALSDDAAAFWRDFWSTSEANLRKRVAWYERMSIKFVAVDKGKIVGLALGRPDELVDMFVLSAYQRHGIGRELVRRFERECIAKESAAYRVIASGYAVGFYKRMGCRKTTGTRNYKGLRVQPMKKNVPDKVMISP
jgi:GNAT superfamily N-acetyltransferase